MPTIEDHVSVTLRLSRPMMDSGGALAKRRNSTVETQLEQLVENGLAAELTVRERLERLSESYRARLAREGRSNQSAEEVMEELRRIREQVADELYPD